jgi:uncharacterized protein
VHRKRLTCRLLAIVIVYATVVCAAADAVKVSAPGLYSGYSPVLYDGYVRSSFYVPMRDGTKLAVDLFRPTQRGQIASERLPVVWMHTPYNRRTYTARRAGESGATIERYPGFAVQLVQYGYNVAVVDFRGLYASYGTNRLYNRGEWLSPARTDAYDVTEWFAHQAWSNGSIGMWGCSATGGSQMQAATSLPPSLKAIMPMSAEFDAFTYAVLGGVANPGPANSSHETMSNANAARDALAVPVDGADGAAQLAQAVAQHLDNNESPGVVPFRDSHSALLDDTWWSVSSPSTYLSDLKRSKFGVYATSNWDEAGTKPGAFFTFNNLPRTNTKLLVGPSTHCAWAKVNEETGFSIVTEELRFFDYWLKGIDNGVMNQRVTYYTYNAPKGSEWRSADSWPLGTERRTDFYLGDGSLSTHADSNAKQDSTLMTPAAQSTYILIKPQSGGLSYQTEPLAADIEVTGHPVMHVWIATSVADADVTARLEDVWPDGQITSYQMLGRLRASERALAKAPYNNLGLPWHTYREADARALKPGAPTELVFDLLPMSYIFKAGHRVQLTLTFGDPSGATDAVPNVTVLRGPKTRSYVTLPIIPAG